MNILQTHPDLEKLGLQHLQQIFWQLHTPQLYEQAVQRHEGLVAHLGPLVVRTGHHTGRSVRDRFIVREPSTQANIAWGEINRPFEPERFDHLFHKVAAYLQGEDVFVQNCYVGADPDYRVLVRVITQRAWHNLFARNMFYYPEPDELDDYVPEYTLIHAPGFRAIPELDGTNSDVFVLINFAKRLILIGGTSYAGEIKYAVFSLLNFLLPRQGVLSMHCSANMGKRNDVALFFGHSGSGKSSLAADSSRTLIGDDEHGWDDKGIFTLVRGCYPKLIGISPTAEPEIYETTRRFGTILENVAIDVDNRRLEFDNASFTENTRAAYPITHLPHGVAGGMAPHPENIIFLTTDAFGVIPPVSKLTHDQAVYYFRSGYTSKITDAGRGEPEIEATFSSCFGASFMPLHPGEYVQMFSRKISQHNVNVWLVNTGWTGGSYGVGHRIKLAHTRAIVHAIMDGTLKDVETVQEPIFGLHIPVRCPNVPEGMLNPRHTWADKNAYEVKARELAAKFNHYLEQYSDEIDPAGWAAQPIIG
jgi:phosphoenolpyruvate carboxykinase (ATP)